MAIVTMAALTSQAQDVSGDNLNLTENGRANIFANGATTNSLGIFIQNDILGSIDSSSWNIFQQLNLAEPDPEIRFLDNSAGAFQWEMEGFSEGFEISEDGSSTGAGFFRIFNNARPQALSLTQDGIVINGTEGDDDELRIFGETANDPFVALSLAPTSDALQELLQFVLRSDEGTFSVRGTSDDTTNPRTDIIRGSLDAPEDALTIQPTGMVSLGVPFSNVDPFGLAIAPIKLRIPGSMFFDQKDPTDSAWLAGTNGDFFTVSDVFTGVLPFRVERGAPTDSLKIASNGNLGVGTFTPESSLHVLRDDGSARLLVEETNATAGFRTLARLTNNGASRLEMTNTDSGRTWALVADFNDQFQIRQTGANTANFAIRGDGTFSFNNLGQSVMALNPNGNLRISGVLTQGSDRNSKENIEAVVLSEVLSKVIDLPVSTWNYITDEDDTQHLGPMAQDFYAAFGLGDDDKKIATLDTSGVALAAIQGLNNKLEAEIKRLKAKNKAMVIRTNEKDEEVDELTNRLEHLEAMVEALSSK